MKYGQYFSQYDIRDIATGSQLEYYLVGENDMNTTRQLKLSGIEYPIACTLDLQQTCSKDYLAWAKNMTRRGYAVTITVYMNYYMFYGNTNPLAGEPDYDHIVSIENIQSKYDDELYHDDDIITFSDHGMFQF